MASTYFVHSVYRYTFYGLLAWVVAFWTGPAEVTAQTATYEITFEGLWTSADHPFPGGAHFSSLTGAVHNEQVAFWSLGSLASPGIERMAETGSTSTLRSEVLAAGTDNARYISGNGLGSTGTTSITVEVDVQRPLVTLVSMIAPSPDWFVGTSGLNLLADGGFADSVVHDLYAYDSGTDSGTGFTSTNNDTNPAEPIHLLGAPLAGTPPLGTFTFELQSVAGVTGDFDADGDYALADIDRLVAGIVSGANSPALDLNADGMVNQADLQAWLVEAGDRELPSEMPYRAGDGNLDGIVDVSDFNIGLTRRQAINPGWSGGDFNADGVTNRADFAIWNTNRFSVTSLASAVPEPDGSVWMLLAVVSLALHRRNRRG